MSAPDFSIPRGDTPTINGTVASTNITGYTITMSVKRGTNPSATPLFTKTAVIDNAVSGTFHFALSASDTNQEPDIYNYDIKVVDASGGIRHTALSTFEITSVITE